MVENHPFPAGGPSAAVGPYRQVSRGEILGMIENHLTLQGC
jgi:hypothetical protein